MNDTAPWICRCGLVAGTFDEAFTLVAIPENGHWHEFHQWTEGEEGEEGDGKGFASGSPPSQPANLNPPRVVEGVHSESPFWDEAYVGSNTPIVTSAPPDMTTNEQIGPIVGLFAGWWAGVQKDLQGGVPPVVERPADLDEGGGGGVPNILPSTRVAAKKNTVIPRDFMRAGQRAAFVCDACVRELREKWGVEIGDPVDRATYECGRCSWGGSVNVFRPDTWNSEPSSPENSAEKKSSEFRWDLKPGETTVPLCLLCLHSVAKDVSSALWRQAVMKESLLSERACGRCAYDRTDSRRGVYEVKPPPSESPHYERLCWGCLEASGAWKGRSLEYLNRSKERCERCGFLADDSYPGTRVYWVPTVAFSAVRADVIPGSKIAWSDVRPLRDPEEMRPQPGRYGAYDPTADRRNDLAKLYDENAIPDPNMRPKCTTPVVPHETVAVGICTCEGCSKVRRIAELRAKGLDEAEPLSALEQADVTRMEREFWAMSGRARSVFARMIQTEGR